MLDRLIRAFLVIGGVSAACAWTWPGVFPDGDPVAVLVRYHNIQTDTVTLPERAPCATATGYYQTALHELGHAPGHPARMDRNTLTAGAGHCGSVAYAREARRADMSAMMPGARGGVGHDGRRGAAYVEGWIKALDTDPKAMYKAAADAQHLSDYLMRPIKERAQPTEQEHAPRAEKHSAACRRWCRAAGARPRVEGGRRHDGGDAETGAGLIVSDASTGACATCRCTAAGGEAPLPRVTRRRAHASRAATADDWPRASGSPLGGTASIRVPPREEATGVRGHPRFLHRGMHARARCARQGRRSSPVNGRALDRDAGGPARPRRESPAGGASRGAAWRAGGGMASGCRGCTAETGHGRSGGSRPRRRPPVSCGSAATHRLLVDAEGGGAGPDRPVLAARVLPLTQVPPTSCGLAAGLARRL